MGSNPKRNIVLVYGGNSVEHEVSILSALQTYKAINHNKNNVIMVYLTKQNEFLVGPSFDKIDAYKTNKKKYQITFSNYNGKVYIKAIDKNTPKKYIKKIDNCLLVVHGKGLEDGTIVGYFKTLGLPTTAPDILSSSIFQNKLFTKMILSCYNINTLPYYEIKETEYISLPNDKLREIEKFGLPVIIKAVNLGSSIGIYKANTIEEVKKYLDLAFMFDTSIIIEKLLVDYEEYNQAGFFYKTFRSSIIEKVCNNSNLYTFDDKYKNTNIERRLNPDISEKLEEQINNTTKKICEIFNIKSLIRVDYLYDNNTNTLYVNEINAIPGSLSYYLFEEKSIFFSEMIEDLLKASSYNSYVDGLKISSFSSSILQDINSKLK